MSRLRQLRPYEYGSSTAVQTEFESIVRYLQSAEVGGQTLAETMAKITDANGNLSSNVELRNSGTGGIEYRVGEYTSATAGWTSLVSAADLRGPAGQTIGQIGAPIFNSRVDYTVVSIAPTPADNTKLTSGQTVINYAYAATDELLVYKDGALLQPTSDYTTQTAGNTGTGTVTLSTGVSSSTNLTIYKVRASAVTNFRRIDETSGSAPKTQIDFTLEDTTEIMVFVAGILYREPDDYTRDVPNNRILLADGNAIPANTNFSVITVEDAAVQTVSGVMMESAFTDGTTGLVPFSKIGINDGGIPQAKVAALTTDLAARAKLFIDPSTADLQAGTVNDSFYRRTVGGATEVVYYDGTNSIVLNPSSTLPSASSTDANKVVQVASDGSFSLGTVDLSGYLDGDDKQVANGVAALDSAADILFSQYAFTGTNSLLNGFHAGPRIEFYYDKLEMLNGATDGVIADGSYRVQRLLGQHFQIVGMEVRCSSGQCNVQLKVGGSLVGPSPLPVGTAAQFHDFGASNYVTIDSRLTTSVLLEANVTGAANSLAKLEIVLKTVLLENN
jgi:hypothetical protein